NRLSVHPFRTSVYDSTDELAKISSGVDPRNHRSGQTGKLEDIRLGSVRVGHRRRAVSLEYAEVGEIESYIDECDWDRESEKVFGNDAFSITECDSLLLFLRPFRCIGKS